jgi:hypothetical protein
MSVRPARGASPALCNAPSPLQVSETTTKSILLGTDDGRLLEISLDSSGKVDLALRVRGEEGSLRARGSQQEKPVVEHYQLDKKTAITGLYMQVSTRGLRATTSVDHRARVHTSQGGQVQARGENPGARRHVAADPPLFLPRSSSASRHRPPSLHARGDRDGRHRV